MANPLVIPAGYGQCVFSVLDDDTNRLMSFSLGAHLGSTEATLAANLDGWFSSASSGHFAALLSSSYSTQQVEVIGHTVSSVHSTVQVGSGSGAYLPPNCALKIKKNSGTRGKANKGYMYWPGCLAQAHVNTDGSIDSGAISSIQTVMTNLISAMTTDGSSPVILHHANSSVTSPTSIVSLQEITVVRTQRRRLTPRP